MILILGAPRTGTTLLYQYIVNHFRVNYFNNMDDVADTDSGPVPYKSANGKTSDTWEPSEASSILTYWWGQEDRVHPKLERRFISTMNAAEPIVIKNIWNVWRVQEWARMFPPVQFIWMRRETANAARSDIATGAGWNGAFRRFEQPRYKEYDAVYQQERINQILACALNGLDFLMVWYEYLCDNPAYQLVELCNFLRVDRRKDRPCPPSFQ